MAKADVKINQPKVTMLSPQKPGKERRKVNVGVDKKSDYNKRGYKYLGLPKDQDLDNSKKPDKTKGTRGTKKTKQVIGTSNAAISEISLYESYEILKVFAKKYLETK
mgnify:CR=1 FL=1